MSLIDLSHTFTPDMPRFSPSAPAPEIHAWQSHAQSAESGRYQGCTCEISEVRLVTSLGTYIDSPYHFHPGRSTIEDLALEQLVLPGLVVDCTDVASRQPIFPEVLQGLDVRGKAVLFHTGWSGYWEQSEYYDFPFLSAQTAQALADGGARLVGIDCLIVDDPANPHRPVHVTLLGQDILIVENLTNLRSLPASGFTFHAAPVKISGAAAFPVRAYAVVEEIPADLTHVRRQDRAMEDEWIEAFLQKAAYGVLALSQDGQPLAWGNLFVYDPDRRVIYVHSTTEGRRAIFVHDNPNTRFCFTAMEMGRLLPAPKSRGFSVEYASVVVYGRASLVDEEAERMYGMQLLMEKYAPHLQPGVDYRALLPEELEGTAVYRLEIEAWSGKRKQAAPDHPGAYDYRV